jgi:hypothetical protein
MENMERRKNRSISIFNGLCWDLNEVNNYYEYRPKDIIFRDYYCAKGVYGYWEDKEVYSL